jgi:hypothetical protein
MGCWEGQFGVPLAASRDGRAGLRGGGRPADHQPAQRGADLGVHRAVVRRDDLRDGDRRHRLDRRADLGTILFFALQQTLAQYGPWYLIILGAVAVAVAIWAPRGLWGLIADRTNLRLFPVGYWLWSAPAPEAGAPRRGAEPVV